MTVSPGFCSQSEGQGWGSKVREKKLTVPKGSVLAYRRKQLYFYEDEWGKQRLEEAGGVWGPVSLGKGMRRGDHHQATLASVPVQREAAFPSCPGHTSPLTIATFKQNSTELLFQEAETVSYMERHKHILALGQV